MFCIYLDSDFLFNIAPIINNVGHTDTNNILIILIFVAAAMDIKTEPAIPNTIVIIPQTRHLVDFSGFLQFLIPIIPQTSSAIADKV